MKSRALPGILRFTPPLKLASSVTALRPRPVGRPAAAGRTATIAAVNPLVAEAASTGFESLGLLEQHAREVAVDFRWNRVTNARRGLADLVNGMQAVVTLAMSAAEASGDDLDLLAEADGLNATEATRRAVNQLVADQAAADPLAIADTIERRFIPVLDAWRAVFDALIGPGDLDPLGHAA